MKEAREAAEMSQRELGERLGALLSPKESPRAWAPQSVYAAEKGSRDFSAAELVALALIFGKPVSWFFSPPSEKGSLELPSGRLKLKDLKGRELPGQTEEMREQVRAFEAELQKVKQWAEEVYESVQQAVKEHGGRE